MKINSLLKLVLQVFSIRGSLALYSLLIFSAGISFFSIEAYGSIMISVSIFGLCARIISWGFDYKIRDLIDDHNIALSEVLLTKLILALIVTISILIMHFLLGTIKYVEVMILAFFIYSFDTMPYFQAKNMNHKPVFMVILLMVFGAFLLLLKINMDNLTSIEFLSACIIVPSAGWVVVSIKEVIKESIFPNFSKCLLIIIEGFQMFTVAQLGGLYLNTLPIIVGFQSEKYVAMYAIVSRISNFGKSFGRIVNQVFFYIKDSGKTSLNFIVSIMGSAMIAIFCCIVIFAFFKTKLDGSFSGIDELITLVILFTLTGSIANFLIIKVFFENRLYTRYRNTAFFLIMLPVISFSFLKLTPGYIFGIHILIEISLIFYCLFFYLLKRSKS
tara:strand:+ start:1834 stop:2994 length:1161 start_codon:yes stop_codon:yes gene_type:complete